MFLVLEHKTWLFFHHNTWDQGLRPWKRSWNAEGKVIWIFEVLPKGCALIWNTCLQNHIWSLLNNLQTNNWTFHFERDTFLEMRAILGSLITANSFPLRTSMMRKNRVHFKQWHVRGHRLLADDFPMKSSHSYWRFFLGFFAACSFLIVAAYIIVEPIFLPNKIGWVTNNSSAITTLLESKPFLVKDIYKKLIFR